MTCLEPHLATGRARPQPPDPTKDVLHLLVLTSPLAQALSGLSSCGHAPLSPYRRSECFGASPPHLAPGSLCVPASGTSIATKHQRSILQTLPAQELSDPGSEPCCSSSPQQGLILCECPLAPSEARTFPPWLLPKTRHKCSCLLWGAWTWLSPEHLDPHSFWRAGREGGHGKGRKELECLLRDFSGLGL